jgi:hypothetical protein
MTSRKRRIGMQVVVGLWLRWATAWRDRRGEEGGVTDETAMIAVLLVVAVAVGGIVYGLVTGAANSLSIDLPSGD